MKKRILFFSLLISFLTSCVTTKTTLPAANNALKKSDSLQAKTKIILGAGISLSNNYKRGNVDQFYQYLSNNPSYTLDDGARGFKFISFGFQTVAKKSLIGMEVQYVMTHPTRAIWGNDTDYGFGTDMHFSAKFINMALKIGIPISKKSFLIFEPGLDIGIMKGKIGVYNSLANDTKEWVESGAVGLGGHGAAGVDLALGKYFFLTARVGYRYIKIDESHVDLSSSTGYSSFYANGKDGDIVKVDWSGLYTNAGIIIAFGK